jgi:hypothetical protein
MKKFNTSFFINGEYYGFAQCTADGAKEYVKDHPQITECEGHAEDEWFTYSVEKGWEYFFDTFSFSTNLFEKEDEDEICYNPYTGERDIDC